MKLTNYFVGARIRLHSALSPLNAAERINEAAGSALWPFNTGVVGGVWAGWIRLRYRSSLVEYNAKPILSGYLADAPGGSSLTLRYGAPFWVYCFYCFWYLFLAVVALVPLANGSAPEFTGSDKAMVVTIFAVLLAAPVVLYAIGNAIGRWEEELADLLDFLAQHAEANR